MFNRNLISLTFLTVLISSGIALADKYNNNGLHEGQEGQQGQQFWQERGPKIQQERDELQRQPIQQKYKQQPKRIKRQFKKSIQNTIK